MLIPTFLSDLAVAPYRFHLTGSRFFGGAKINSDWDFFAAESDDIKDFLVSREFQRIERDEIYCDRGMAQVYHHPRLNVHIQLVNDVKSRLTAQRILTVNYSNGTWVNMSKFEQRGAWDRVLGYLSN